MITYTYKLSLQGPRTTYTDAVFTAGDVSAYRLGFTFVSEGKPYDAAGCTLAVKAKRSDGVVVTDGGTVAEDGRVYYDVKSSVYAAPGELSLEIALCTPAGGYITTHELMFRVREGHGAGDLTAENTTPILSRLTERAMQAEQAAQKAAATAAEADKTNRQLFANALTGTAAGSFIQVDDVSPVAHVVHARVSGVEDPTALTVTACGKNLFGVSISKQKVGWDGTLPQITSVDDNNFTIYNPMGDDWTGLYLDGLDPTQNYVMRFTAVANDDVSNQMHVGGFTDGAMNPNGYFISWRKFTVGEAQTIELSTLTGFSAYGIVISPETTFEISNFQIEVGETATDYTPYVDPTSVAVTACGKNLFGLSTCGIKTSYDGHTPEITNVIDDNSFTIYCPGINDGIGVYVEGLDRTKWYTVSCTARLIAYDSTYAPSFRIYNSDNYPVLNIPFTEIGESQDIKVTFQTSGVYVFPFLLNTFEISNLQIEVGEIATDFEPFVGANYTPDAEGNVSIESISPVMTLFPDVAEFYVVAEGVTMDAAYNKDTNKVIEQLTNAIISMGGNV